MKRALLSLFGMLLMVTSCSKTSETDPAGAGDGVEVTLKVNAPDAMALTKTVTESALNSGKGGYTNMDKEQNDVRFILEVWSADGSKLLKDRLVNTTDESQTKFTVRLTAGTTYKFVLWADYVAEGSKEDAHYNTSSLKAIVPIVDGINDECRDAYFATKDIKVSGAAQSESITLTRPFAKLRVITTDMLDLNEGDKVTKVKVTYDADVLSQFNVMTGEMSGVRTTKTFEAAPVAYTEGLDADEDNKTLFVDYFLAPLDQQSVVKFTMTSYNEAKEIRTHVFDTDIAVRGNFLTTVRGNFLTTGLDVNVNLDDDFAGESDGEDFEYLIKVDANTYKVMVAEGLYKIAELVNSGEESFKGKTILLGADIDMTDKTWTPIGNGNITTNSVFQGTFDGQDFTISNLTVKAEKSASAGLFGAVVGTVKNLKMKNVKAIGNYKAAAIVADGLCTRMENCHVDGAVIISTPWLKNGKYDDANHVGGLVGYLTAQPQAWIKNSSIKNAVITGYRDLGGIAGTAQNAAVVTGNTAENVKVIAARLIDYVEATDVNAGEIVGRTAGSPTISDNNATNVTVNILEPDAAGKVILPTGTPLAALSSFSSSVKEVVLSENIEGSASASNPYSTRKNGINMAAGMTLDGNNYSISSSDAYWTITNHGGTIKNLSVVSGEKAVVIYNAQEDVIIDNCTLGGPNVGYGLNTGEHSSLDVALKVSNSTLVGWISYAGLTKAEFTNVKFQKGSYWKTKYGYSAIYDMSVQPYIATTFTNCAFDEGYQIGLSKLGEGSVLTFINCTYGGVPVTQSNVATLIDPDTHNAIAGHVKVENNSTTATVKAM